MARGLPIDGKKDDLIARAKGSLQLTLTFVPPTAPSALQATAQPAAGGAVGGAPLLPEAVGAGPLPGRLPPGAPKASSRSQILNSFLTTGFSVRNVDDDDDDDDSDDDGY